MFKYTVTFVDRWGGQKKKVILAASAHNAYETAIAELGPFGLVQIVNIEFREWQ